MAQNDSILLLDGATGTELGRRGIAIALPLWSASALLSNHGCATLRTIHEDYLRAGCDFITANTFRTHRRSLAKAGLSHRAADLTRIAVHTALIARDRVNPAARVLASCAPLEDCYQPHLAPSFDQCEAEHGELMQHALDAGADGILIETQNNLRESLAAARAARRIVPHDKPWLISFCMATPSASTLDAGAPASSPNLPATLLSGEPLTDSLDRLAGAFAVGVNCVPVPQAEAHVKLLRLLLPPDVRVLAYPNIGNADGTSVSTTAPDGGLDWICNTTLDPELFAQYAARWVNAGASIIGGCCGTTPEMIAAVAKHLARA